jgi:hypothetical protein
MTIPTLQFAILASHDGALQYMTEAIGPETALRTFLGHIGCSDRVIGDDLPWGSKHDFVVVALEDCTPLSDDEDKRDAEFRQLHAQYLIDMEQYTVGALAGAYRGPRFLAALAWTCHFYPVTSTEGAAQ